MSNSSKIQTMSDDLDELKNSSQDSSQQAEAKKEEPAKENPVKKAISADNATKQMKVVDNVSDVAKQVNSGKSIVESVINSMANGEMSEKKQEDKNKSKPDTIKIKRKEGEGLGLGLGDKDINELQSLVNRISDTIPEKEPSLTSIGKKEVFTQEELPSPNIEPPNKEMEERINREIDEEMKKKPKEEAKEGIKEDAKEKTRITMISDPKADKNSDVNKEEKEIPKNEDAEKLKSLINRISKTAEKESIEKSITEKKEEFKNMKKNKAEKFVIPDNEKDDAVKMPLAGKIQKKSFLASSGINAKSVIEKSQEDVSDHNKADSPKEKSFWSNISEKLKKSDDSKKINEIKTVQNKNKKVLENEIKKSSKTGILTENSRKIERAENEENEENEEKFNYLKGDKYVSPENRLIHGKQKFYSSVSKRVKLRKDKDEMEGLKSVSDIKKKQKILSREEEYKKLKKSIVSKYHIKLFQMPWKKIIPIALVLILVITLSFYSIMSFLTPKPSPSPPLRIVSGEGLSEFASIEKKITISESSIKGLNKGNLEENAKDIFNENRNLKVIRLVIVNTEDKENRNILSLKNSLDALGIIDIGNNRNHLPERFLEMSMDKYDFFIFRTKKNHIRYGIAIGLKDRYFMSEIMEKWERERSANKKMIVVLKPLFAGDRNYEDIYKSFNSANYNGIEIKYVHLIDEDTALNYFIYNNDEDDGNDLLVLTTSKDSTHAIIDLLADNR